MLTRFLLGFLFVCSLRYPSIAGVNEEPVEFEGRIEYAIRSAGADWSYTLWLKGTRWRSELKLGQALYELKIGDNEEHSGYLVNEGGKNYRSLSRRGGPPAGGEGMQGGKRPGGKGDKERPDQIDPEKFKKWVQEKDDEFIVDVYVGSRRILKGEGKAFDIYSNEELGMYSPLALPTFKSTQEKGPLFGVFFRTYPGIPLSVKEAGNVKKAFSMVATEIIEESVDESLLTIPEDYTLQAQMMGGPSGGGGGSGKRKGPPPSGGGGGRGPR